MIRYYLLVILMTILGAFGAYYFKTANTKSDQLIGVIKSKTLYIGILFYLLGALLNIYVLKYLPYNIVLPTTSITYIWSMLIAHKFLGEHITKRQIYGLIFIIAGVILLAVSNII